jgi:hypothetical protein
LTVVLSDLMLTASNYGVSLVQSNAWLIIWSEIFRFLLHDVGGRTVDTVVGLAAILSSFEIHFRFNLLEDSPLPPFRGA